MRKAMTYRVDWRVKKLKAMLALLNSDPEAFARLPLAQLVILKRLAPVEGVLDWDLSPAERARHTLMALVLAFCLDEVKKGEADQKLSQGFIFFWNSFLEPIDKERVVARLERVIRYCAEPEHLDGFLAALADYIGVVCRDDKQMGRKMLGIISASLFRQQLIAGLSFQPSDSDRRTLGNYLNHAALQLAIRIQAITPEVFGKAEPDRPVETTPKSEATEVSAATRRTVAAVDEGLSSQEAGWMWRGMIDKHLRWPPGDRDDYSCPACYLERSVQVRAIRGKPVLPSITGQGAMPFAKMSGLLTGMVGSGRTTFMQHLAHQSERFLWTYQQAPLALHFPAADFALYARNRRSVYEFLADRADPSGETTASLREDLAARDQAGKVFLLVDNLNELSEADQTDVIAQLAFSPAVIFATVPWQVERVVKQMRQRDLAEFVLTDLDVEEQSRLLELYVRNEPRPPNLERGKALLAEYGDLAKLPLGVVAVFKYILQGKYPIGSILQTAFCESFKRAGLIGSREDLGGLSYHAVWKLLLNAAETRFRLPEPTYLVQMKVYRMLMIVQSEFETGAAPRAGPSWERLSSCGLFVPGQIRGEPILQLVNADLVRYVLLMATIRQHQRAEREPERSVSLTTRILRRLQGSS